jgi:hypothetical protein
MTKVKTISSIFVPFFFVFLAAAFSDKAISAQEKEGIKGPVISYQIESGEVDRVLVLQMFLEKHHSPLAANAETFVEVADKYGLDYRLLPAISCMESTCGRFLLPESHNAWGWGIYGNQAIYFEDFDQAIEEVGRGIYEGYVQKGLDTPRKMAPIYTPPRPGHWLGGVNSFMEQMDDISQQLADSSV